MIEPHDFRHQHDGHFLAPPAHAVGLLLGLFFLEIPGPFAPCYLSLPIVLLTGHGPLISRRK